MRGRLEPSESLELEPEEDDDDDDEEEEEEELEEEEEEEELRRSFAGCRAANADCWDPGGDSHPRGATPLGQGQRACHCGHQRRTWSLPLPQRKGAEGLLQRWSGPSKNETGLKADGTGDLGLSCAGGRRDCEEVWTILETGTGPAQRSF